MASGRQCPACGSMTGWLSRTGVLVVFLLSFAVSAAISMKLRSYAPYTLVPVALLLAVIAGVAFGHLGSNGAETA